MTKGSYSIRDDPDKIRRKDTSFKSFICALLVFLALCLIIFLATYKWSSGKTEQKPLEENDKKNDAEVLPIQGFNNTRRNEQQVVINVPETTSRPRETTKFYKIITQPVTKKTIEEFDEVTTLSSVNFQNESNEIKDEDKDIKMKNTTFYKLLTRPVTKKTTEEFNEITTLPPVSFRNKSNEIKDEDKDIKMKTTTFYKLLTQPVTKKTTEEFNGITTLPPVSFQNKSNEIKDKDEDMKMKTTTFYKVLTQPVTTTEEFDEVTTLRPGIFRNETNEIKDEDRYNGSKNLGQTTLVVVATTTPHTTPKSILVTTIGVTDREESTTDFEQQVIMGVKTTKFFSESPTNRNSEFATTLTYERIENYTTVIPTIEKMDNNSKLVKEVPTEVFNDVIPKTTTEEILITTADSNVLTTRSLMIETTTDDNKKLTKPLEIVVSPTAPPRETTSTTQKIVNDTVTIRHDETTSKETSDEQITESLPTMSSIIFNINETTSASNISKEQITESSPTVSSLITDEINETTSTPQESLPTASSLISRKHLFSTKKSAIIFKNSEPLCRSSACNSAASRMLSLMNHSTSPCEDFYEFACGGTLPAWQESAESSDADMLSTHLSSVNNLSDKYLRDYRNFYDSCAEHENSFKYGERIKVVKELLGEVGKFCVVGQPLDLDLTDLFAKLIGRQSMPLFDVGLDVDRQSSNFILQLTLPQESSLRIGVEDWSALSWHKKRCLKKQRDKTHSRFLNLNENYLSYLSCQKNYSGYLNSIEDTVREMGIFDQLNSTMIRKEIKDIRFMIEFDILNLLDDFPPPAEIRKIIMKKSYDIRRVSDLQAQYPILKWEKLLTTLTGHNVEHNAVVQVYFGKDFTRMFNSLANVDRRVLNNALLAIYANDLFMNTVVSRESLNRELFCLELSQKLLPDITSYLVKSWHLDQLADSGKKTVSGIFAVLKENFSKSLMKAEWLDDTSRISIMSKFNKINLTFFTEPHRNRLISDYENVNVTDNYQKNFVNLLVHSRQAAWATEGTQFSAQTIYSYFLRPTDTKPLIFPTNGLIAVPLGLLKRAADGLPGYLIMAHVGLHLAREIARNFDPTEIKFVKLSETAQSSYNYLISTTETLMDYSSPRLFENQNITFKLNGALSTNERITENAAFRLILDSFNSFGNEQLLPWISSSYSREKIFFIGVAQEYCRRTSVLDFMLQVFESANLPAALRVENIIGNSEVFSEKFSCPEGSGMNLFTEKLQFPYLNKIDDYEDENEDLYKN